MVYDKIANPILKVAKMECGEPEIFYTLQGEGINTGVPSIFIRLSLCNLYCVWCDTDYTWNWEGTPFVHLNDSLPQYKKFKKEDMIIQMSVIQVMEYLDRWDCRRVVLTGGEPMIQQKALIQLAKLLRSEGYHIEVETNATRPITPEFDELVHEYNCSPKLESSGNKEKHRLTKFFPEYVANPKTTFKYVIVTPEDLEEVLSLIERYSIPQDRVILMPEGRTREELAEKSVWLAEIAKQYNLRFTPRLQVNLWGAKRAV